MGEDYTADFATVYDTFFSSFADDLAPRIHDFYAAQPAAEHAREVLDLGCGTGQVARFFLERGFRVTGVDLSEPMLAMARANTSAYVADGSARFLQADVAELDLDGRFGLVVSTFDALNHLPDEAALEACFRGVAAVSGEGSWFVFDLATRLGIERWNRITLVDTADAFLVRRGSYDGGSDAHATLTGFVRDEDGRYRRFEQQLHNRVFEVRHVIALLRRHGWPHVQVTSVSDLGRVVRRPEREERVVVLARR